MSLIKTIRLRGIGSSAKDRLRRGIAAVELALTMPIWIAIFLGCADAAYMMLVSQRADRIAYGVTDIVTQSKTVTKADLDNILLAAGQLMNPFEFGDKGIVILTSLYKPAGQATQISWQHSGGGGLARESKIGKFGLPPTMPPNLTLNDQENVIVAEVYYAFKPMFINASILSEGDFYRVAIYKPRLSPLITPPL